MGCAATRHRNTSCIATVFLNIAKYSLEIIHKIKGKTLQKNTRKFFKQILGIILNAKLEAQRYIPCKQRFLVELLTKYIKPSSEKISC